MVLLLKRPSRLLQFEEAGFVVVEIVVEVEIRKPRAVVQVSRSRLGKAIHFRTKSNEDLLAILDWFVALAAHKLFG